MVNSANVRVTTGNPTADTILKWGFWIGIGLATYRLYRVVRYDDPFIQPSYRLPPAWEANPRKTDEEKRARALELYEPGEPVGPVAEAVGVSSATIIRWMKEAGIYETAREGPRDTAAFKRALELYEPGKPVEPVAKAVGVSWMTIINWMKKAGVYEAAPVGSSLGPRDEAVFKRALELYKPGEPVGSVAKEVGVDKSTIINWMKKAGVYEAARIGREQKDIDEKRALAFALYEPGEPVGPVAKAVGVSPVTIINWMKNAGIYEAAEQHPLGPRDTAAYERALELYEPGRPVEPVAEAVGVSSGTIIKWMKKAGRYKAAPLGGRGSQKKPSKNPWFVNGRNDKMLTICVWCKRVRVGGKWVYAQIDEDALVTHGMCEDCAADYAYMLDEIERSEKLKKNPVLRQGDFR